MPRGRICSICRSPHAALIDADLSRKGLVLRDLSRKWEIPRSNLHHHRQKHLTARLKAAAEQGKQADVTPILDRLAALNRYALSILSRAATAGEYGAAVAAIREAREQLTFEAKLLGQLREGGGGPTINLNVDEATAERIARTYLERRLPPALPAQVVDVGPVKPEDE